MESSSIFLGFWGIVLFPSISEELIELAMTNEFFNLILELDSLLHIVAMVIMVEIVVAWIMLVWPYP